jgi:hypothetical protein
MEVEMVRSIPWGIVIALWLVPSAFAQFVPPAPQQPNIPFTNDDAANNIVDQMQRDDGQWPDGAPDDVGLSDAQRRRLAAQQTYFQARLDMQRCEQRIAQLENELPSARGDRRTQIERDLVTQQIQRRNAELRMADAQGQWDTFQSDDAENRPPQSATDELRRLMDIRHRLSAGDPNAINDALEYLRWKYGQMPEGLSAYDWLAGSEEFGSAIRGFVIMEAERIRVRLREGDETAIADAWKLWRFINISDFWFRRFPDLYTALANSDLFGNAMRAFVRKKIQQINDMLEAGDEDAVEAAMRLWRFMHAEMFKFRAYPDWHELFGNTPQFSDAYQRFIEVVEQDLQRRLSEGDKDAIDEAASHLRYKQGASVAEGETPTNAQLLAGSSEFGDAYRDGFKGQ